ATPREMVSHPADGFVAAFTGANLLHGIARPGRDGLTEVVLETGETIYSADEGAGRVDAVVYPWEISVGHARQEDSAQNMIQAETGSLARGGTGARVGVGRVTAEITATSVDTLDLKVGTTVVASFKATGTKLVSGVAGT